MALHERISDLIGRIYETADDPVGWPDVCADILKELGGRHMLVTLTDTKNLQCSKVQYFGAGDDLALIGSEEFAGGMCAGDPVLAYAEAHPQALCVDSRRLTASGQFLSWYYDRFKSDHYLVGYTPEIRGMTFGTSIHVQENRPVADERLFRMLFGHMVRAAHLAMTGNRDNQEKVARIELDELGRVIRSNGVASELLDQGIALHLDGRRLRAKNSDDDGNLQRALNNALGAQFDGGGSAVVRIRNQDGKHAFYVKATPQPSRATIAGMF